MGRSGTVVVNFHGEGGATHLGAGGDREAGHAIAGGVLQPKATGTLQGAAGRYSQVPASAT